MLFNIFIKIMLSQRKNYLSLSIRKQDPNKYAVSTEGTNKCAVSTDDTPVVKPISPK